MKREKIFNVVYYLLFMILFFIKWCPVSSAEASAQLGGRVSAHLTGYCPALGISDLHKVLVLIKGGLRDRQCHGYEQWECWLGFALGNAQLGYFLLINTLQCGLVG